MRKVFFLCLVYMLLQLGDDIFCNPEIFDFKIMAGTPDINRCPTDWAKFPLLEMVDIGKSFATAASYHEIPVCRFVSYYFSPLGKL